MNSGQKQSRPCIPNRSRADTNSGSSYGSLLAAPAPRGNQTRYMTLREYVSCIARDSFPATAPRRTRDIHLNYERKTA